MPFSGYTGTDIPGALSAEEKMTNFVIAHDGGVGGVDAVVHTFGTLSDDPFTIPASGGGVDLTSAALFLRADLGVTQAGTVSSWADQSTAAQGNFTQATGGNRPAYDATGLNTHPCITFAQATPTWLENAAVALNSTTLSVFILLSTTSSSQENSGVISLVPPGGSDDFNSPGIVLSTVAVGADLKPELTFWTTLCSVRVSTLQIFNSLRTDQLSIVSFLPILPPRKTFSHTIYS